MQTGAFATRDWGGSDFFVILVENISAANAALVSQAVDGHENITLMDPAHGKVRSSGTTLYYFAIPVK